MHTQEERLATAWYTYLLDNVIASARDEVTHKLCGSVHTWSGQLDPVKVLKNMLVIEYAEGALPDASTTVHYHVNKVSQYNLFELFASRGYQGPLLKHKSRMEDIRKALAPDLLEHVSGYPVKLSTRANRERIAEAIKFQTRGLRGGALVVSDSQVLMDDLKVRGASLALPKSRITNSYSTNQDIPAAYHLWLHPDLYQRGTHQQSSGCLYYVGGSTGVTDTASVIASMLQNERVSGGELAMALLGHTAEGLPSYERINSAMLLNILAIGPDTIIAVATALKETMTTYGDTVLPELARSLDEDFTAAHKRRWALLTTKLMADYATEFSMLSANQLEDPKPGDNMEWFRIARDYALQHGKEATLELVKAIKTKLVGTLPSAEDFPI